VGGDDRRLRRWRRIWWHRAVGVVGKAGDGGAGRSAGALWGGRRQQTAVGAVAGAAADDC